MSKRFNATPDREVFPAIESEATGIFVRQAGRVACNLDKFKLPIRPLELRRSENQCLSGYDICTVALHVNDGAMAQMFGFFGGERRNRTDKEQTARLSWARSQNGCR